MVEQKIKEIVNKQLGISEDKLTLTTNIMEDLGADSIDMIEMMLAMEQIFNIKVPDEAAENLITVADVIKLVEGLVK